MLNLVLKHLCSLSEESESKSYEIQHGFEVSQEIFDSFKNDNGTDFKPSLVDNTKGLLQLYEASFIVREGEDTLELARQFATKFLQRKLDEGGDEIDTNLLSSIQHSLEIPLHWRIQRQEARWFIDAYATRLDSNPVILELAKLDFNIIQAKQEEELKEVSRWWKSACLAKKLPFERDRLVESYFWTVINTHFVRILLVYYARLIEICVVVSPFITFIYFEWISRAV